MNMESGKEVRIRLASADASGAGGVALTMWDENAQQVTLGSTQRLYITDIHISIGATALAVQVFDDANANNTVDAGEELINAEYAINGGLAMSYLTPMKCGLGRMPRCKTSAAGNVKISGTGFVKAA
jgi:hypothetical protein